MSTRSSLAFLSLALVACGGATTAPENGGSAPAASAPTSAPATADPASRISFAPDQVAATRAPAHAECQEKNATFTDDDAFTLAATKIPPDNGTVQSVFILFRRTVTVGAPVHLLLGPSGRPAIGDDALQAHAPDARTGPDVSVVHPGWRTGSPPANSLTDATVTLLQLASTDGERMTGRVELRFDDGSVLDATFSAPLESYAGACGER